MGPRGLLDQNDEDDVEIISRDEMERLENNEDILLETISKGEIGADDVLEMLEKQGMKIDIFRVKTLLRMVDNTEYTMRVFVR